MHVGTDARRRSAAAENWPKFVFTSGFFSGTWAKQHGQVETIMIIR